MLSLVKKDNNWTEDFFFLNTKLKDFSREESASQSRTKKEDTEQWIIPAFLTKKKIKSLSSKKKSKTSKKDSEDPQREKINSKRKSSD